MLSTTVFPGRYVQGAHAFKRLGREMARFGAQGFLICDPWVLDHLLPDYRADIEQDVRLVLERFGGECSDEEIARITAVALKAGAGVVAGMGGGKTVDTAKAVAVWLAEHPRIQLHYLPKYCSHLNPVEGIWLRLKGRVAANRLYASMPMLLEAVNAFFDAMTPAHAHKWAGA